MYQPQTPLIEISPRFTNRRLGEIELGQLILLGDGTDAPGSIGIRGDALSRRGDLMEGLFRLSGHSVIFQRHGLEETLAAIEIEYDLQADLAGAMGQARRPGDLLIRLPGAKSSLLVAGPWDGKPGLLDLASAVARPYTEDPPHTRSVALSWRLVDRNDRTRVLFQRGLPDRTLAASDRIFEPPLKRPRGEDCD